MHFYILLISPMKTISLISFLLLLVISIPCVNAYAQVNHTPIDPSGYIKKYDTTFTGIGPKVYFLPEPQRTSKSIVEEFSIISTFKDSIQDAHAQQELLRSFEYTLNHNSIINIIKEDSITINNYKKVIDYQIDVQNTTIAIGLLNEFAKLHTQNKDYQQAESLLEKALGLAQESKEVVLEQTILSNLSALYTFNKKYNKASLIEDTFYETAKKDKSVTDQGKSLVKIALLEAYQKDFKTAESTIIRKAIPLFNRTKDYNEKINAWINLARIYTLDKRFIEAQWFLIQAQELADLKNIKHYNMVIEYMLGSSKFYQENLNVSKKELNKALILAKENNNKYIELATIQMLGEISVKQNRLNDAESLLKSYWKLRDELF